MPNIIKCPNCGIRLSKLYSRKEGTRSLLSTGLSHCWKCGKVVRETIVQYQELDIPSAHNQSEGTEGQDRQNYTDTQDRHNYISEPEPESPEPESPEPEPEPELDTSPQSDAGGERGL